MPRQPLRETAFAGLNKDSGRALPHHTSPDSYISCILPCRRSLIKDSRTILTDSDSVPYILCLQVALSRSLRMVLEGFPPQDFAFPAMTGGLIKVNL